MSLYRVPCPHCQRLVTMNRPPDRCSFCDGDMHAPPVASEPKKPARVKASSADVSDEESPA